MEQAPTADDLYWLHVQKDGQEVCYRTEPVNVLSLQIERRGKYEYTRTCKKLSKLHIPYLWFAVQPPGYGWKQFQKNYRLDHDVWRRLARKGARQWAE